MVQMLFVFLLMVFSCYNFYLRRSIGVHDTFGKVSNIRLVVGSIPTSYQSSETSLGTSVFTAPTDYLTRSSQAQHQNVELLICQSGALIDNATSNSSIGYSVTASGNASSFSFKTVLN